MQFTVRLTSNLGATGFDSIEKISKYVRKILV